MDVKKLLILTLALLLALQALPSVALAEAVTVRLMFTYFNSGIITTETTTKEYQEFENVDSSASIMYLQEYYLKQKFPELTAYGTSPDNVLAYTDVDGNLYDGVENTIGQLVNPEKGFAELYIWVGSTYLYLHSSAGANDDGSFVYDFLGHDAYQRILPEHQGEPSVEGIIATTQPLTQVFLNSRSVEMRVKSGDFYIPFTESVEMLDDLIRLTLTTTAPTEDAKLDFTEIALFYLNSVSIEEICLVNGDDEQVFTMGELRESLGIEVE